MNKATIFSDGGEGPSYFPVLGDKLYGLLYTTAAITVPTEEDVIAIRLGYQAYP